MELPSTVHMNEMQKTFQCVNSQRLRHSYAIHGTLARNRLVQYIAANRFQLSVTARTNLKSAAQTTEAEAGIRRRKQSPPLPYYPHISVKPSFPGIGIVGHATDHIDV